MGIADRLSEIPRTNKGPGCTISMTYDKLTEVDAAAFLAAIVNPEWPVMGILTAMDAEGFPISESTLRRHRRKRCKCVMFRPELVEGL